MELIQQTSLINQANLYASRNYKLLLAMIGLYIVSIFPLTFLYVGEIRNKQNNEIKLIYINPAGDLVRLEQGKMDHIHAIRFLIKKYITMQRTVTKDYKYTMQQVWNSRYLLTENALQCLLNDPYNPDPQVNRESETTRLWKQGINVDVSNIVMMTTDTDYRYLVQWTETHSENDKLQEIKKQAYFKMVRIKPTGKTIQYGNLTEWSIDYYSMNEGDI